MVRSEITEEVKNSEVFSIMADETKDVKKKEQISLVVRYYFNGAIQESFLHFELPALKRVLQDIAQERNGERSIEARGLLAQLDLEFIVHLVTLRKVFGETTFLSDMLQSSSLDLSKAVDLVGSLVQTLNDFRQESFFDNLWDEVLNISEQCDTAIQPAAKRQKRLSSKLAESFLYDANIEDLGHELHQFSRILDRKIKTGMQRPDSTVELVQFIEPYKEVFFELFRLCKIAVAIPVSSASCERSFSTLKLVKTFLRSTITDERLSNLGVLSIESRRSKALNLDLFVDRLDPAHHSEAATWANEVDPRKACQLFREELLERNSECPRLFLSIDMFDAEGDAAVGQGVNRLVLSMAMQKLKTGFSINLGCAALTSLFEGEMEHRVPSAAAVLRESNLFEMAGRMIGHSFLHGGFGFSGLSVPVVTLDWWEHGYCSISLKNTQLTAQETTSVTDLCLSWDLPVPTSTNHDWLFQELLSHAVLHRVRQRIKQIHKGLKETGIWPLVSNRPDVHPILFPREKNDELNSQTVIQNIHWPQPKSDSDEDGAVPLEKVLRDFMKFWVGWELLTTNLEVEVVTSTYLVALTCFLKLKFPSHYQTYEKFHQDLMMALSSISSGFGLV
ncbi:hypothetical protein F7725_009491 [Dissostichus mawsoni]|uniref:HAT C-terminal dimerisation domain-containing protein n=1 Tax=Dissostichus mawsoni TaxID=36200 RepID=A0A7J5XLJ3_DISMA|nr:hypothetical protein F7725_009491 [Dissostichus mawsoni]